jgi:YVTN family beta-propeller protein
MRRLGHTSTALAVAAVLALICAFGAAAAVAVFDPLGQDEVGQTVDGGTLLPDGQVVTPAGASTMITDGRLISSTLSPNGQDVAVVTRQQSNGGFLSIVDVKTGKLIQQVGYTDGVGDGSAAEDGPLYSADGKTLWFSQATDVLRFSVNADGTVNSTPVTIKIPKGPYGDPLASGMALSADGSKLYVALNGSNALAVIDTATNTLMEQIPTGVAPRQVQLVGNLAYVSDEGGRHPGKNDFSNTSDGAPVIADPSTGAVADGTVSVINLQTGHRVREIPVGLQPTALFLDGTTLFVANSNDDSVSVINTHTEKVVNTVDTHPVPGQTVGSAPNALDVPAQNPHLLLVSLGRANAIAEYSFASPTGTFKLLGLIPTEWYPTGVTTDPALDGKVVITSDKGIGAREPYGADGYQPVGPVTLTEPEVPNGLAYQTYNDTGSVATVALPDAATLSTYTNQVFRDNGWNDIAAIDSGQGDTVPTIIPPKLGERSQVIKHVVLVIRENRTYDQVLGDLGEGNGDPDLALYGTAITPNAHSLARRFGDLDNFYDPGTLSADGHNWILQADANDYVEKDFSDFYRSYPASGADALAYQRDGFLWNRVLAAGETVRNYGEYENYISTPGGAGPNGSGADAPSWTKWYQDSQILEGKASGPLPIPIREYHSWTDVPSLEKVTDPYFPEFDLDIPDQYRVDIWDQEFQHQVATNTFPDLTIMTLMCDHTSSSDSDPTTVAEVADNDLALGRLVDTISHSKEWASTAIFVEEDDSQAWVDHVDGHRTVAFVISPYSNPGVVDDYYTQVNMTRTIEQILGVKPMNLLDGSAVPMYGAFTNTPNFTPYDAVSNTIPLGLGIKGASPTLGAPSADLQDPAKLAAVVKRYAVPAAMESVYQRWVAWGANQHFSGTDPIPDYAYPWMLNRFDWYDATGWRTPYPGDPKVYPPDEVPPPTATLLSQMQDGT